MRAVSDRAERRAKRAGCAIVGVVTLLVVVWLEWPRQEGDPHFDARVPRPTYTGTSRPRLVVDAAHWNVHTLEGRYRPFADLARNDGYAVAANEEPFTAASLRRVDLLVVANALGRRGAVQQVANAFRLEKRLRLPAAAFTPAECAAVERWVRAGGALLLVADHAPAGRAALPLASRFGVGMSDGYTEDLVHHDPTFGNGSFLDFSRRNGLLADHPITRGRHQGERIDRVITYTGQSLSGPPRAVPLLRLSPGARDYPFRRSADDDFRSAAGRAQALALEHGRGRVVVMAEAAALTSQTAVRGGRPFRFGMARQDADNRQLVLNLLHWLSRAL